MFCYVSVSETAINMTNKPTSAISENIMKTLTCKTSSANPPSDVIWDIPDYDLFVYNISHKSQPGQYNGNYLVSRLSINVSKELNGLTTKCVVDDISDQYTWNITC